MVFKSFVGVFLWHWASRLMVNQQTLNLSHCGFESLLVYKMKISFPKPSGIEINMMPIIIGDKDTLPGSIKLYDSIIASSGLPLGSTAYLSIIEKNVHKGYFTRRPGIHTDGINTGSWGGGSWGGGKGSQEGIYMASNDGRCRVWNKQIMSDNSHGTIKGLREDASFILCPNKMYRISDRTPHESLCALSSYTRQWIRIVADKISVWFEQHNTPSPFGVLPNAFVSHSSKF